MGLFKKRYADDDWSAGVPESFKTWFWIRLAVSLYVGYIGGDLIWRWISDGLAWWYVLLGSVFIIIAVIFLIFDIRSYVRLKAYLKKKEAEAAEAGEDPAAVKEEAKPEEREGGIRSFATYVVPDDEAKEDEADDQV